MMETTSSDRGRILLATDLTSRCDRAFDRAVQLSRQLSAELIVAYVTSPPAMVDYRRDANHHSSRKFSDPMVRARSRLDRYFRGVSGDIRSLVEQGDPAEKLAEIAERENCCLIVAGPGDGDSLDSILLGNTINRVLRSVSVPILSVHDRPHGDYRKVAVTCDFSDASFQALQTAAKLFPQADFTLFHAFELPFGGLILDRDIDKEMRSIEKDVTAKLLQDPRLAAINGNLDIEIGHGLPEVLLGDFVERNSIDLTVIGSHGRGAAFDFLIGSTAKRLVETLEGDLLIVRYKTTRESLDQ